jgi:hypothetical protein
MMKSILLILPHFLDEAESSAVTGMPRLALALCGKAWASVGVALKLIFIAARVIRD